MPTPCLIFNADDYGLTPAVSHGIRQAHQRGLVTSTTALMNQPTTPADLHAALTETPQLGLGVHLNLTLGRPLTAARTLTTPHGTFWPLAELPPRLPSLDLAAVETEWRAQIDRFGAYTGRAPTHLDAHHHVAYLHPALVRLLFTLARDYACPVRHHPQLDTAWGAALQTEFAPRLPAGLWLTFFGAHATPAELRRLLANLPPTGCVEVMCHPGHVTPALQSSYRLERARELAVLTAPALVAEVRARARLITFAGLTQC